jgi:hypothetical protein
LVVPPPPEFLGGLSNGSGGTEQVLAPPPQFSDNRLVTRVRIVGAVPKTQGQESGLHSQWGQGLCMPCSCTGLILSYNNETHSSIGNLSPSEASKFLERHSRKYDVICISLLSYTSIDYYISSLQHELGVKHFCA